MPAVFPPCCGSSSWQVRVMLLYFTIESLTYGMHCLITLWPQGVFVVSNAGKGTSKWRFGYSLVSCHVFYLLSLYFVKVINWQINWLIDWLISSWLYFLWKSEISALWLIIFAELVNHSATFCNFRYSFWLEDHISLRKVCWQQTVSLSACKFHNSFRPISAISSLQWMTVYLLLKLKL